MEIIWSPAATNSFISILKQVEELFGSTVAMNVSHKIKFHVGLLSSFPRIGVRDVTFSTEDREIRYLVNTPNIVYYAIEQDAIYIIAICDSRQSPKTIHRKISELLEEYK